MNEEQKNDNIDIDTKNAAEEQVVDKKQNNNEVDYEIIWEWNVCA